ncbi:MAG: RNA polymerase factor sigma-54 [Phycisphaeraceae bacterium]
MRIDVGQQMRVDQRMKLAPRMIQSMEILQMPLQALEARIEQELSSNPTLELREPGSDAEVLETEREQAERDDREGERELTVSENSDGADDFERLNNLSEEYSDAWDANTSGTAESYTSYRKPRSDGERDAKLDAMANTAARGESLYEQLLAQWRLVEAPAPLLKAGEFLLGFIDGDGYLRTPRDTLLQQAPPDLTGEDLDEALDLLQRSLDPPGLGARDLRECLLLQIAAREANDPDADLETERLIVAEHLEEIAANRLPRVARATGLSIDEIKAAILSLRQFPPHPGRLLADEAPRTIQPDAIVEYDDESDRYMVRLTNNRLPALAISDTYAHMAHDGSIDKRTRDFVSSNMRSARWLLDAIRQRSATLLRVISVVLDAQRDYFDHGPQALRPLPMTTVADQLGIHVATVSRAVSEKYLQTPRGIVPLRMFFSGGTETESGDSMSWAAIQAKLEEIIDAEDKAKPLSDDQLVEELKTHGIEIARRTVAKYRKQLNIPPARQRKEY